MINISSVIIARNEENNIARCIDSQLGCIDEIIVLIDSSTTDRTEEIVRSYKNVICEVINWKGYAVTKQLGVNNTSNEWVFWIDADEALTPGLKEEILLFKNSLPEYSAYSIPRAANFLGKWIRHSGWYPGRVVRLFHKNKAKFSNSSVHEYLIFDGVTGTLMNDLEHYTDPSIQHYFDKYNHYTSLAAEELFNKNKKFSLSDILIRPWWLFMKMYFIRRGFLDGLQGFILAVFSASYVFTKYCKLWELNNKRNNG